MKLHKTTQALVSRGIPSDIAAKIANEGYNLLNLKQMNKSQLIKLGLNNILADKIQSEKRPPIPSKTLTELLFESRYSCCVCRKDSQPIVVHHIIPWEKSHSHNKDNLVVLCPIHHDEAHTKRELSISLNTKRLKSIKQAWLDEVKHNDKNTILSLINENSACWDFFNLHRIFELSSNFNIHYAEMKTFQYLLKYGYIDKEGLLCPISQWQQVPKYYWLDMMHGMYVSDYMREIFVKMLDQLPFKVLNEIWSITGIQSSCKTGDFVVIQGAFYFKDKSDKREGEGQLRYGYRKARGIQFDFFFDAWYCTSSTAKCTHLTGRSVSTVFAIVREIKRENNLLKIRCSVLAIGSYFNPIYSGRYLVYDDLNVEAEDN